jgi:cellulose synthase/poly-beta-1,6-N-acetylglucosamine synthase-like glycosyltransferase
MNMVSDPAKPWPVMVLAHNEERHIEACLDSIVGSNSAHALETYVMANACTDATEQIVRDYGRRHPEVKLVSIELGDKCNAWNVFIHDTVARYCPDRETYFFMDGDARSIRGSFDAMHAALQGEPHAHAASARPGIAMRCFESTGWWQTCTHFAARSFDVWRARAFGCRSSSKATTACSAH